MSENIGTPVQAIEFAMTIDDHYDMREFLGSWSQGDLTDWPEFLEHINPKPPAPPAWMVEVAREAVARTYDDADMAPAARAYRAGDRDDSSESKLARATLRLALERGHVVEPREWTEEELLKAAREDAAQLNRNQGNERRADLIARGGNDRCDEFQSALQARRNMLREGAVAGLAVPAEDLDALAKQAWDAGWRVCHGAHKSMARSAEVMTPDGAAGFRRQDVSRLLSSLPTREA